MQTLSVLVFACGLWAAACNLIGLSILVVAVACVMAIQERGQG